MFSNREIATAIWLFLFMLVAISRSEIRRSLGGLIKSLFAWKILLCVGAMAAYTVCMVAVLGRLGIWTSELLKDTVYWFVFVGFLLVMESTTAKETENLLWRVVRDNVTVLLLVEFIAGAYTFSLVVELVLFPVLAFVAILDAYSASRAEYASVHRITRVILGVIGVAVLCNAIWLAINDLDSLGSWRTARNLVLTPLLSLLFVPFVYVTLLISTYEEIWIRIQFGVRKEVGLRWYALRKVILRFRLNLTELRLFQKKERCK